MRFALGSGGSPLVFAAAVSALLATAAFTGAAADDKHGAADKHGAHTAKSVTVKASEDKILLLRDINGNEQKFDLNKESDKNKLIKKLANNEIAEIEVEQNPMAFSADLGLWALVIFVALIFILRKLAWAPMVEGLQKREQTIRAAVDEAKIAREETETAKAKFKAEMDRAFAEIPKLMEKARHDGEKLIEEMRAKATAEIAADRDRLRREIELAKDQAMQALWDQTAQLATLISANVLAKTITPEDHHRMLDLALTELKSAAPRLRQDIV